MAYSYDRTAATERTAADEVTLDALLQADPWVKGLLAKLTRFGLKRVDMVWSGIHGNILQFAPGGMGKLRFTPEHLVKLSKLPRVRWYEFGERGSSVAIEGSWIGD